MKPGGILALAAACTAMAAAGYGYWHAATHATFSVSLAYRTDSGVINRMRNGQIEFLDENNRVLARASIDTRYGVVWLAHPDIGQCGPDLTQNVYRDCVEAQAAWIPHWVHRVRYANVALEQCSLARRRVQLDSRRDNLLLWWLPLPHVGGLPYTRYSATLAVDTRNCP